MEWEPWQLLYGIWLILSCLGLIVGGIGFLIGRKGWSDWTAASLISLIVLAAVFFSYEVHPETREKKEGVKIESKIDKER